MTVAAHLFTIRERMRHTIAEVPTHPLVRFGKRQGWNQKATAAYFAISYSVFRQMVRGFTGCSFQRADEIEKRSEKRIRAIELLRWHEENRRGAAA